MSEFVLMSNETLPGEMAIQPAEAFDTIWKLNGWVEEGRGTELEMRTLLNPPKPSNPAEELEAPPVDAEFSSDASPMDGPLSGKKSSKDDSQKLEG